MNPAAVSAPQPAPEAGASGLAKLMLLMTRERWIEVARIAATGLVALLYWQGLVPIQLLWVAVAVGVYPLGKTGALDRIRERKIGTEIFVTIATLVAMFGGKTAAGAVLMVIILIAEFIAELNTDRARASIKALIGSVPQFALVRGVGGMGGETTVVGVVDVLGITAALLGWIGPIHAALLHLEPHVLVFVNSVKLLRVRIAGA